MLLKNSLASLVLEYAPDQVKKKRPYRPRPSRARPMKEDDFRYKVEDGIPIPPPKKRTAVVGQFRARYPFARMKVGQSFFVPAEKIGLGGCTSVAAAINFRQQKSDLRYCWRSRTLAEDGEFGIRVWRER